MSKQRINISDLFLEEKQNESYVKVAAPMVRYSKLEFRQLLRKYKAQLCFTPMIIAESFCRSSKARINEFTTNQHDTPLIAQFAAKNSIEFGTAAELVYPYVDGVDLNCGCPQSWAIAKGYGCALLKQPTLLHDMLRTIRRNLPNSFSCSMKIRLLHKVDSRTTIELCRQLEACGITFITIHGRTAWQKTSEPVNIEALADIKKSVQIPIIVNGDVKCLDDANRMYLETNCDGVMAARGLLTNPTLFANTMNTTMECIQDWINISAAADKNITFQCFHHHLTFMLEKIHPKRLRTIFNSLSNKEQVFQFIYEHHGIQVQNDSDLYQNYDENLICTYDDDLYDRQLKNFIAIEESSGYSSAKSKNDNSGNDVEDSKSSSSIQDTWNEKDDGKFYLNFFGL